jgi:hypothetical protein
MRQARLVSDCIHFRGILLRPIVHHQTIRSFDNGATALSSGWRGAVISGEWK